MSDHKPHNHAFDASLPLPNEADTSAIKANQKSNNSSPAADLIRQKVQAAYANEPSIKEESVDQPHKNSSQHLSKHQKFIAELTSSGRPLHEIQTDWHEYYSALPDDEKHKVWHEFYQTHAKSSQVDSAKLEHEHNKLATRRMRERTRPANVRHQNKTDHKKPQFNPPQRIRSLLFGLGVGSIVVIIFLFSFFNERFIAPFIQPSRNVTNTQIIAGGTVGPNPKIVIPKINVDIPVVYDLGTVNESEVQNALERGVVHYADTAVPGQDGNGVIVGHSSNNLLNKGRYKFAFVLLSKLENGDTFYLHKDGIRYTYKVYKKEIVNPSDVSVLGSRDGKATITLITCDPPGTSLNRLVVVGEQISPDPDNNSPETTEHKIASTTTVLPGNAPSLWSRMTGWLF